MISFEGNFGIKPLLRLLERLISSFIDRRRRAALLRRPCSGQGGIGRAVSQHGGLLFDGERGDNEAGAFDRRQRIVKRVA